MRDGKRDRWKEGEVERQRGGKREVKRERDGKRETERVRCKEGEVERGRGLSFYHSLYMTSRAHTQESKQSSQSFIEINMVHV